MTLEQTTSKSTPYAGLLAEFDTPDELLAAVRALRIDGHEKVDAFTPFPVHGLDQALGLRPTRLPWLVLGAGIAGGTAALWLQWWTNTVDYPFIVSGKPTFSLPANIPVTFEVIILASATVAFLGMLGLSGLPRLANPLFRNERFKKVTNDGFFLFVDSCDAHFDPDGTLALLQCASPQSIATLPKVAESQRIPRGLLMAGAVLGALALIPPFMIASARSSTSDKPRLHTFFDMDFQQKFKSQTTSQLFEDGRAMRPRIAGTVPRGHSTEDRRLHFGVEPSPAGEEDQSPASVATSPNSGQQVAAEPNWVEHIPLPITTELMKRGRERFNIHCSVCHGRAGAGNGLASLRALELEQGTWVPPTSLHAQHVRSQLDGQLFHTITNGVRKMPAYGHQIEPQDRWAIVLYVRALQRSQNASLADTPADVRPTLREMN